MPARVADVGQVGGAFAGFRYATRAEFDGLTTSAFGADGICCYKPLDLARTEAFAELFGPTGSSASPFGFGLPTLTTRRTAIPETTLGLAHYIEDPGDVGEWAERIVSMARDPGKHRPGEAGAARVRSRYAPDRIAQAYVRACAV